MELLKPDTDDEYEEEEYLVYVDMFNYVSHKEIHENGVIKLLGINTDKPVMQINNRVFEGEWDYAMGTNVFFVEDTERALDPVFDHECGNTLYKFFDKTNKVLKMSRVAITEKQTEATDEAVSDDASKFAITKTYEEALSLFLPPGRRIPRKIPEAENGLNLIDQSSRLTIKENKNTDIDETEDGVADDDDGDSDYIPFEERHQ